MMYAKCTAVDECRYGGVISSSSYKLEHIFCVTSCQHLVEFTTELPFCKPNIDVYHWKTNCEMYITKANLETQQKNGTQCMDYKESCVGECNHSPKRSLLFNGILYGSFLGPIIIALVITKIYSGCLGGLMDPDIAKHEHMIKEAEAGDDEEQIA